MVVAARDETLRAPDAKLEPVWTSVPAIWARPPTSAVVGRKTTPARRTAGLLFILAASVRALRPTVFTPASNPVRALPVVSDPADTRDAALPRDETTPALRALDVVDCALSEIFTVRAPLRTAVVVFVDVLVAERDTTDGVVVPDVVAAVVVAVAVTVAESAPFAPVDTTTGDDDFSFVPGIKRDGVTAPSVANAAGEKHANATKHVRNLFILCLIISQVPAT